jgi:hypothetical protein
MTQVSPPRTPPPTSRQCRGARFHPQLVERAITTTIEGWQPSVPMKRLAEPAGSPTP